MHSHALLTIRRRAAFWMMFTLGSCSMPDLEQQNWMPVGSCGAGTEIQGRHFPRYIQKILRRRKRNLIPFLKNLRKNAAVFLTKAFLWEFHSLVWPQGVSWLQAYT